MSTDPRRYCSRRVASRSALSTGPVSGPNATTTHGPLTADNKPVTFHHLASQAARDAIERAFYLCFCPLDLVEATLVNRLVDSAWRRHRYLAKGVDLSDLSTQRLFSGFERSLTLARRELQILQKDRFHNLSVQQILALSDHAIAAAAQNQAA